MNTIFAVEPVRIGEVVSTAKSMPTVAAFIGTIVNNAIMLAGVIAFIFIIIGGFGIITGGGDPKKLGQGRQTLTMAVIGFLVVVFSLWFIQAIKYFIGFDPLSPPGI
jgi:hypothetical protein